VPEVKDTTKTADGQRMTQEMDGGWKVDKSHKVDVS